MVKIENGLISFCLNEVLLKDCLMSLDVDDVILKSVSSEISIKDNSDFVLYCKFPEKNIKWEIFFKESNGEQVIESKIMNYGKKAVKLGKVFLLDAKIEGFRNEQDEVAVFPLQIYGQKVYRIDDPEMPENAKVIVQFSNNTRNLSLQGAFLTFQRCNTELVVKRSVHGLDGLQAYCDFAGWELAPGKSTSTEIFRIIVGDNPYTQLENWADKVKDIIKPDIWENTPLGFNGCAWAIFDGKDNYAKVVSENLNAINKRLAGFGFKYLWTSMHNFEGSLPGNWLKWNYKHIPCGRKKFIKMVRSKGFLPGFWIAPFYLCSSLTDLLKELEDAILQNLEGEKMIVCEEWRHGDAGKLPKKERPCIYALDPSHPKTIKFLKNVFKTYRKWGIRYYMVDFLEAGAGNISRFPYKKHFNKKLVAGPEVYTNALKILKKTAGKDTYLLSSTGPQLHNAGILDGVRVGNDFGEGRDINKESFFYPASYVINKCDFWTGPKEALLSQAVNYFTHRKFYIADSSNLLTVDKPIPLTHAQIHATIHAFSGGPTILGDDIRNISEERLNIIKKTLPRSKEIGFPVDLFTSVSPDYPKLFLRSIVKPWGEYKVLAIYNFDPVPKNIKVPFETLGMEKGQSYLVWDFWNEKFEGKRIDNIDINVRQESVTVLRFVKDKEQPVILGTDMHIMMGEMEIKDFEYNSKKMECCFTVERPKGESGTVFIYAPENIYVKKTDGLHISKDGNYNTLVIAVPLKFKKKVVKKIINFGQMEKD
ncbi:MAG TPA: hypothetical protein P5150_01030 [Candidatus Ratteibacteria bacterium]|nr:hypothetical protein [Candidatus Ratteibacteria bacterium]